MQQRRLVINALSSIIQVVVMGGSLFFLYRFVLQTIGVGQLGVWSIVLATTSVALIANLGLSASVVKYVAKYAARDDHGRAADVIQTSVVTIGVIVGLVLILALPVAQWVLQVVLPSVYLDDALRVLPFALTSLWITVIAGIFQAGLDGYQRIDQRNWLLITAALGHLLLCYWLVPALELQGLAYAQVTQASLLLLGSWALLKRRLPLLPMLPVRWSHAAFKEMIMYGVNFQVITISRMLYDPVTKALLTKYGGPVMTGYYEMASRMILQLRALLVTTNQVVVPAIADLQEKNPEQIDKVYKESYGLLFFVAFPLFSAVVAFAPVISEIWIGQYERTFVLFAFMLAAGWFVNTLSAPVYFANLGIGELRWNTIAHVTIAILNIGLCWLLGSQYGGTAVVAAWTVSLIIGSAIIPLAYHSKHQISIFELLPIESSAVGIASVAGIGFSLLLYYGLNYRLNPSILSGIVILVFSGTVVLPIARHPLRKCSMGWVNGILQTQKVVVEK